MSQNKILHYEGALLQMVAPHGEAVAMEYAEAMADAALNAMIRIRGRRKAAEFAFQLSDRIATGMKGPTIVWEPDPEAAADPAETVRGNIEPPAAKPGLFRRLVAWLHFG